MSRLLEALKKEVKAQAKTKGQAAEATGKWGDDSHSDYIDHSDSGGWSDNWADGGSHSDGWSDSGWPHHPNK